MIRRRRDAAPDSPRLSLALRMGAQGIVFIAFATIIGAGAIARDPVDLIIGFLGVSASLFACAEIAVGYQTERVLRRRLAAQYQRAYNAEAELSRTRRMLAPTAPAEPAA